MGDEKHVSGGLVTNPPEPKPSEVQAAHTNLAHPLITGDANGVTSKAGLRLQPFPVLPPFMMPTPISSAQTAYPAFPPQVSSEPFFYRSHFPRFVCPPTMPFFGIDFGGAMQFAAGRGTGALPMRGAGSTLMQCASMPQPQQQTHTFQSHGGATCGAGRPGSINSNFVLPPTGEFRPFPQAVAVPGAMSEEQNSETGAFSVNAYKRRNVYKSIIRYMHKCISKDGSKITKMLTQDSGYAMPDVEQAFFMIENWNNLERQSGTSKKSQTTVEKILSKRSVITYILRETLWGMMQKWKSGKTGKISDTNLEIYEDVCTKYYKRTIELTGQSVQCTNLDFWR